MTNPAGKEKVRDVSRKSPTDAEADAVYAAFRNGVPMVCAILGQALIEYELEKTLRQKFKLKDDSTWDRLIGENGPLATFNQKIICGYAFGIYDDVTRHNLSILKDIRNAFAHSKRIISFDEVGIKRSLSSTRLPIKKRSKLYRDLQKVVIASKTDARAAFTLLCQELYIEFIKLTIHKVKRANRNLFRSKSLNQTTASLFGLPPKHTAGEEIPVSERKGRRPRL
jgi:hypothetical protein